VIHAPALVADPSRNAWDCGRRIKKKRINRIKPINILAGASLSAQK
jgi:hypothetical protein